MSDSNPTLTDLRRAELLDIEQIADVIDSIDEMIYQYNMDKSHYLYISPNANDIVGIPREEIYTKDFFKDIFPMVHPDDSEMVMKTVNQMIANPGELHILTFRKKNPDGSVTWIHERARSKVDEKSGDIIVTGAIRNISAEKAQEQQISKLQKKLNEPCK